MSVNTPINAQKKAFAPKQCAWWDCGQTFAPDTSGQKFCCEEHKTLGAEEKAIARKNRNKSGGGRPAVNAKFQARTEFIQAEMAAGSNVAEAVSRLPKPLQWTAQAGIPHRHMTELRRSTYLGHLAKLGNAAAAAMATDGIPNTARAFRALAMKDSGFAADVRSALDEYGAKVHATVHKVAVEGVLEPIVSMGQIVGHKRVFSEKLLLALSRVHSKEMREANSGNGGTSIAINIRQTGMQQTDDGDPVATIKLSETWLALTEAERDQLMFLYSKVLAHRDAKSEPQKLDWSPPAELKEVLDLEAVEVPDDI